MVVTAHPEASKVGLNILKQGGNAVDASIAIQLALAVVYPNAGNLGGGGFMVLRNADGSSDALDFREKAPKKAHRNMYLDKKGAVIENLSFFGGLASGVPGTVDGLFKAHAKYGKLDFNKLIDPAIELASNGFAITAQQAEEFNAIKEYLDKYSPNNNYLRKDSAWKAKELLIQKDLANTMQLIKEKGRDGFYRGETAEKIIKAVERSGGIMSLEDLFSYEAKWRMPISGYYKNFQFISMPPPSSGGIALYQLFNMLENYRLDTMQHNGTNYMHILAEAERRVYADRSVHLGDDDFYPVPHKNLTDSLYLLSRMKNFNWNKANISDSIKEGKFVKESEETTHFSVVDENGNAVSVTTTLNGSYGSMVFVDDSGFLMNNEMDDFSAKPGVPNYYGLIGAEANAIESEKRMLSSMSPTIISKDRKLFMVVGTPGGSTIITSVLQTVLNVIEFKMNMQEAVAASRFHHQWKPDKIFVEKGEIDSLILKSLELKGHQIQERSPIGRVDAILIKDDGSLEGGADPRGDDAIGSYTN